MGKIKLNVTTTVEEAFRDFIASCKAKGLADKTLAKANFKLLPGI